jgi:hypothetical protein
VASPVVAETISIFILYAEIATQRLSYQKPANIDVQKCAASSNIVLFDASARSIKCKDQEGNFKK